MFTCITFYILYTCIIYISDNKIILSVSIAESKKVLIVHLLLIYPSQKDQLTPLWLLGYGSNHFPTPQVTQVLQIHFNCCISDGEVGIIAFPSYVNGLQQVFLCELSVPFFAPIFLLLALIGALFYFRKSKPLAVICNTDNSSFVICLITVMVSFAIQKFLISLFFMVSGFHDLLRKAVPTPRFLLVLLWFYFFTLNFWTICSLFLCGV